MDATPDPDTREFFLDEGESFEVIFVHMDANDDADGEDVELSIERTRIAEEVDDLRTTILRLAKDRERLPQPLFWSLFNSRLKDIKRNKELSRLLDQMLNGHQ